MTARLASIQRHPLKSHGRETLEGVRLTPGCALPWDRHWAVAHDAARLTEGAWAPCQNFSRGSKAARLTAISAKLDEGAAQLTLTHPDQAPITFAPDDPDDAARFIDWVRPLCPPDRAQPARIFSAPDIAMTDTDYQSVSVLSLASNADLSARMGQDLSPLRWRMRSGPATSSSPILGCGRPLQAPTPPEGTSSSRTRHPSRIGFWARPRRPPEGSRSTKRRWTGV